MVEDILNKQKSLFMSQTETSDFYRKSGTVHLEFKRAALKFRAALFMYDANQHDKEAQYSTPLFIMPFSSSLQSCTPHRDGQLFEADPFMLQQPRLFIHTSGIAG